jgi:hypothetical protein
MNGRIIHSFTLSLFIFSCVCANHTEDVRLTKESQTQAQNDTYQQLLDCPLEDQITATCCLCLQNSPTATIDDPEMNNRINSIKNKQLVALINKLSHEEKLNLFANWIYCTINQSPNFSITKQSLMMLFDANGALLMGGITILDYDNPYIKSNKFISPSYFDALLKKMTNLPELQELRSLITQSCYILAFIVARNFMENLSEKKPSEKKFAIDHPLSLNKFIQFITSFDPSLDTFAEKELIKQYKNKLNEDDLKNSTLANLLKKVQENNIENLYGKSDQSISKDILFKEFKKLSDKDQLALVMICFSLAHSYRLICLYSNILETL